MPPIPPLIPRSDETFVPPPSQPAGITNDPTNPYVEFIASCDNHDSLSSSPTLVDAASTRSIHSRSPSRPARPSMESDRSRHTIQLKRTSSYMGQEPPPAQFDPEKRHSVATLVPSETTSIGDEGVASLFQVEKMQAMSSDNLFMHLYQAVNMVLAMREAMWDELEKRVHRRDPTLVMYGWEPGDFEVDISRKRFDALIERYRG